MFRFTLLEKFELTAIAATITLVSVLPMPAGTSLRMGGLVTAASLTLLLQGFCRDVWRLLAARRAASKPEVRYAQCLCVESAVGLTGIIAAAGLTALGSGPQLPLRQPWVALGAAGVLVVGFLLKDFVFEWSPWRLYRAKDHATLHFRWKR